ncbi:Sodium/potassium-transporting ATPase subunit gamma isoform X1 [Aix galericulata]|nr:Sodium/potassium-transporting ATPase subunit gamma isoform X1 [Aix galericulata]
MRLARRKAAREGGSPRGCSVLRRGAAHRQAGSLSTAHPELRTRAPSKCVLRTHGSGSHWALSSLPEQAPEQGLDRFSYGKCEPGSRGLQPLSPLPGLTPMLSSPPDYETIRNGGLIFAVVAFVIGLLIILSKCLGRAGRPPGAAPLQGTLPHPPARQGRGPPAARNAWQACGCRRRQRGCPQGDGPRSSTAWWGFGEGELGQGLQPREASAAPLAPRPAVPLRREEEEEAGKRGGPVAAGRWQEMLQARGNAPRCRDAVEGELGPRHSSELSLPKATPRQAPVPPSTAPLLPPGANCPRASPSLRCSGCLVPNKVPAERG